MKIKLFPYLDAQDLTSYALALQGKDNGVDAYSLSARLDCFENVRSMLDRGMCKEASDEIYWELDALDNLLPRWVTDIRSEKQLIEIGEKLGEWLEEKTGEKLEILQACNPANY